MNDNLKEQINRLKDEIESLRPIEKETEARIQQKFRLDWNYHSNNIEGNSLTFGETKTFLLHGITAAGKPLKDHLDVKGHNEALLLLEEIVKDERPINETFIRELHKLILHEPYKKPAVTSDGQKTSITIEIGKYKTQPNHVDTQTGETLFFAKPEETPAMMNDLMQWYNTAITERNMHPVELAALLQYKFIRIHPFDDGNGRLSRILMNLTLMKFSFPPVIIKTQKKEEYIRALQQADGGDTDFFVDYIANLQLDSLSLYLKGAKGESIEEEDDIDKEIALFKSELNKKDAKLIRDFSNQTQVVNGSILPLIKSVVLKTRKLDDLFSSTSYVYYDDYYHKIKHPPKRAESLEDLFMLIDVEFTSNLNTDWFTITFSWEDFDNSKTTPFTIHQIISFKFTKYRYSIKYRDIEFEKTYDEDLTSEVITLSNQFASKLLSEIKQELQKK